MADKEILKKIAAVSQHGERAALATVISADGSTPGKPGFKLLIKEDGSSIGTVGGGCTEEGVKAVAKKVIEDGKNRTFELNLEGKAVNCGGKIKLFVEKIN